MEGCDNTTYLWNGNLVVRPSRRYQEIRHHMGVLHVQHHGNTLAAITAISTAVNGGDGFRPTVHTSFPNFDFVQRLHQRRTSERIEPLGDFGHLVELLLVVNFTM